MPNLLDELLRGSGSVNGPSESTNHAIATWDGTTGRLLRSVNVTTSNVSGGLGLVRNVATPIADTDATPKAWVEAAIAAAVGDFEGTAASITYDPSVSGLDATDVQAALDEITELVSSGAGTLAQVLANGDETGEESIRVTDGSEIIFDDGSGGAILRQLSTGIELNWGGGEPYALTITDQDGTVLQIGGDGDTGALVMRRNEQSWIDYGSGYTTLHSPLNFPSEVELRRNGAEIIQTVDGGDVVRFRRDIEGIRASNSIARSMVLRRARGTLGSPTAVQEGDTLGAYGFSGYDGGAYRDNAGVICAVTGAVSSGVLPSGLGFVTGSTAPVARAVWRHDGGLEMRAGWFEYLFGDTPAPISDSEEAWHLLSANETLVSFRNAADDGNIEAFGCDAGVVWIGDAAGDVGLRIETESVVAALPMDLDDTSDAGIPDTSRVRLAFEDGELVAVFDDGSKVVLAS